MKLADYVVTESGFAADLGSEKFMDIICRYGGFAPSAVVITCTMRALKMHGGLPVDPELLKAENNAALEKGCENLAKQIENMKLFGVPVVVTINRFAFDRDTEIEIVRKAAVAAGAEDAVPINVHALGGDGGQEAAEVVKAAADQRRRVQVPLPARRLDQGEDRDDRHQGLRRRRRRLPARGRGQDQALHRAGPRQAAALHGQDAPLAVARPALKGRPRGFRVPIRDIRPATGAGYLYPLLGEMRTMPGLAKRPAAVDVDIDIETGRIIGLF